MSPAENKAIVRQLAEAFNEGNLDIVDTCVDDTFVLHHPLIPQGVHGPEGLKQFFAGLREAMPDIHHPVQHILAEGDLVAIHLPIKGTFQSPYLGIPATGTTIDVTALNLWRLADGNAVEAWFNLDTLGMMQQMGVVPQLGAS